MEGNMPPGAGGGHAQFEHPSPHAMPHAPQSDGIISDVRYSLFVTLQEYGWFVLLGCVLIYFAYNKISNSVNTPSSSRSASSRGGGPANEDPDQILERQEKIAAARARMQAQLDENVEKEKIKIREREEHAREKKIEEWENLQSGKGYYSKMKSTTTDSATENTDKAASEKIPKKEPLAKPEYNPLMGGSSGASCSWRPSARRSGGG